MNPDELEDLLKEMTGPEFAAFCTEIGYPNATIRSIVESFVKEPAWEKMICRVLGRKTGVTIVGEATVQQARDQRRSVILSWIALIVAVISLVISLLRR